MCAQESLAARLETSGVPHSRSVSWIQTMSVSVNALPNGADLSEPANALTATSSQSDQIGVKKSTVRTMKNGPGGTLGAYQGAAHSIWNGVTRPCSVSALKTDSGRDVSNDAFLSTVLMARNSTSSWSSV